MEAPPTGMRSCPACGKKGTWIYSSARQEGDELIFVSLMCRDAAGHTWEYFCETREKRMVYGEKG